MAVRALGQRVERGHREGEAAGDAAQRPGLGLGDLLAGPVDLRRRGWRAFGEQGRRLYPASATLTRCAAMSSVRELRLVRKLRDPSRPRRAANRIAAACARSRPRPRSTSRASGSSTCSATSRSGPAFTDHFIDRLPPHRGSSRSASVRRRGFACATASSGWTRRSRSPSGPHLVREHGRGGRGNRIGVFTVWELAEGPSPSVERGHRDLLDRARRPCRPPARAAPRSRGACAATSSGRCARLRSPGRGGRLAAAGRGRRRRRPPSRATSPA